MKLANMGAALGVAVLVAGAGSAYATTLPPDGTTYDTGLANGWYDGSSPAPQGGFTVAYSAATGIEIGLRAKYRSADTVIDSPNNVYTVSTGVQAVSPSHAAWNYEFSIDSIGGTLDGLTATLEVTDSEGHDVTTGNILDFAQPGYFGDNSKLNAEGQQNSENPIFAGFPLRVFYNPWIADDYTFTVRVFEDTNLTTAIASDTIQVDVVPEPITVAIFGAGLLGMGLVRRRQLDRSHR